MQQFWAIKQNKTEVVKMFNLSTNINQKPTNRQPSQHILKSGQKVYLYDDTKYTGTLLRPVERTYPPRWTIELDRGGYDSAIVAEITPIELLESESESNLEIPFSDSPSLSNSQREKEIIALKKEVQKLKAENQVLKKDLEIAKQVIRRAKDISPLMRISLKRVLRLAHDTVVTSA